MPKVVLPDSPHRAHKNNIWINLWARYRRFYSRQRCCAEQLKMLGKEFFTGHQREGLTQCYEITKSTPKKDCLSSTQRPTWWPQNWVIHGRQCRSWVTYKGIEQMSKMLEITGARLSTAGGHTYKDEMGRLEWTLRCWIGTGGTWP